MVRRYDRDDKDDKDDRDDNKKCAINLPEIYKEIIGI